MDRSRHTRVSSINLKSPTAQDMYHRPYPTVRSSASSGSLSSNSSNHNTSPRLSPLLPSAAMNAYPFKGPAAPWSPVRSPVLAPEDSSPTVFGMPLKYVSLVTLAVQNAALSIVMHYSRVSTPPSLSYSPASAVLLNELLKGSISFIIALARVPQVSEIHWRRKSLWGMLCALPYPWTSPFWTLCGDIFSPDCWKLSIPAILYVVQNSLQFVAVSNLPVASFQVTYQMKILTTAAFSVALLRKRLSTTKWLSLFFLAIGVGIVQIQTSTIASVPSTPKSVAVGSAHESAPHVHIMSPLKGFGAVTAACFTSGLAGVYFEMVLKNSKADLWVRNVQLSLFSLIPALLPVLYSPAPVGTSRGFLADVFRNFGGWAWATVAIQVLGGLVTAVVIKYSDNILKGFATSLSIILSSLASVALFDFCITPSFVVGSSTVLAATWMYNQPAGREPGFALVVNGEKAAPFPFPGSPVRASDPIIGLSAPGMSRKKSSPFGSPRALAAVLGLASDAPAHGNGGGNGNGIGLGGAFVNGGNGVGNGNGHGFVNGGLAPGEHFADTLDTQRYLESPYGSPWPSRAPSRTPSRAPTPLQPRPLHSDDAM